MPNAKHVCPSQEGFSSHTVRLKQVKFHHNNSTYVQVKLYPYGMQNSQLYVKFHQDNIGKKLTCISTNSTCVCTRNTVKITTFHVNFSVYLKDHYALYCLTYLSNSDGMDLIHQCDTACFYMLSDR